MRRLPFSIVVIGFMSWTVTAQVSYLANRSVSQRMDTNLTETTLTAANVNVTEFGKLYSYRVDGPVFAQPVYVAGEMVNGARRNVLYVPTVNDTLYAFDAESSSGAPLQIARLVPRTPVDATVGARMGGPVWWESPTDGPLGYAWSRNDVLKAYRLNAGRIVTPAYMHGGVLSPRESGASLTLSANGSTTGTGIVWASMPSGDVSIQGEAHAILRAFDAETLNEIWTSEQNSIRDRAVTFPKHLRRRRLCRRRQQGVQPNRSLHDHRHRYHCDDDRSDRSAKHKFFRNLYTGVQHERQLRQVQNQRQRIHPDGNAGYKHERKRARSRERDSDRQYISDAACLARSASNHSGIGAGQGVEARDGKVYLYGDASTGVIREYSLVGNSALTYTGRQILLTAGGRDLVSHPTGLTTTPGLSTLLGNTVAEKGTIFIIDWARALASGTLDGAVQATVTDDLAVNGTRPEFVRVGNRWLVATADYGAVANEVRLYDPERLKTAARTSEPGVLVYRFRSSPYVQTLHWLDAQGLLVLVQNQSSGQGWRLTVIDLARSIAAGQQVVMQTINLSPQDELEGFHLVAAGRALFVTSSSRSNLYFANVRLF